MHYFMTRDGHGWKQDRNNMAKSLAEAKRNFGANVSCIIAKGHDVYWCAAVDTDHFLAALAGEGVGIASVEAGSEIAARFKKEQTRFSKDAGPRVSHPKFGEGTVIHGQGTGRVLIQFDTQKKHLPMVESFVSYF